MGDIILMIPFLIDDDACMDAMAYASASLQHFCVCVYVEGGYFFFFSCYDRGASLDTVVTFTLWNQWAISS